MTTNGRLVFTVALWSAAAAAAATTRPQRPHIVFILADDLGWNDVGFHGSNQIPTPNIDALAYTGIVLDNYYVTPLCTPTRSALMTAKYPMHTGLQHGVIHGSTPYGLSPEEVTLAEHLKRTGYRTRAVGKWHLGSFRMQHGVIYADEPWGLSAREPIMPEHLKGLGYATRTVGKWHLGHYKRKHLPESRGFDSHYGYWTGHQDYYDHFAQEKGKYWGYDMRRGMNTTWDDYGSYTTDLFTDEAVKIIRQHNASVPLFLYIAHLAVHSANSYKPLEAPPETVAKFSYIKDPDRRTFAGMLSKLDDSVGDVVSALSQRGMLQNCVVVFSTDNGGPAAGFNRNAASNWPLRGVKDTLFEGGVKGVGVVWSPLLPSGVVSRAMMHVTDWLPTLMHAAGAKDVPEGVDGVDLWSSLSAGKPSPRKEVIVNIDSERNIGGLVYKNYKYIEGNTWDGKWNGWYGPSGRQEHYNWKALWTCKVAECLQAIRPLPTKDRIDVLRQQSKIFCHHNITNTDGTDKHDVYLFDLSEDPCEQNNLALTQPQKLKIFSKLLKAYKRSEVRPRNKPSDPRSNPIYWGYQWINWMDYLLDDVEKFRMK